MYKKFVVLLQILSVIRGISSQCGVPSQSIGLIIKGNNFERGKWPWMTAVMLKVDNKNKFICGGVLVSRTKAGHCIHPKYGSRFNTRDISLLLGAYDLDDRDESGVYNVSPESIILHPDWNPQTDKYDADIAALILQNEVPLTTFIQPICIGSGDLGFKKGFITGWGKSEDETKMHENKPKELEIPIWTNEHCFLESYEFVRIASKRTFCAGSRDGRGVCSGDSGSGFFLKINGVFFLKGLVSASLLKDGRCDVSNFALFTNIDKFVQWIDVPSEQFTSTLVENEISCGIMSSSSGLVQNGKKSSNNQWPWAVVVFNKALIAYVDNETFNDFEIGSLISEKHVIADGNFLSKNESGQFVSIATDLIKTYFGVTSIDNYENVNSLVLDGAEKIILHPDFGRIFSLKFANFAIVKLKTKVTFSQFISPVCLSSFSSDPYSLVGKFGYGVGYGYSANGKTKHRFHSPMRVRSKEDCDRVYDFSLGTAKDKRLLYFCAGGDNSKSSACWSDHPLYMKINEKWYLHAFVQVAFNDGKGCRLDLPVLYEIAGHYYTFILNEISKT